MNNKPKKKFYKKWWFWIIVVVIVGVIGANGGNNDKAQKSNDTSKPTAAEQKKEDTKKTKVNYENFASIKMGMKYSDVVKVLGEGREETSSEVSGIKTAIYSWSGPGISNMNVTVQNGVVTGKAQAGLKDMNAKVTLEKYNSVKEGMTYDQIKAVLGEGELTSQTKIMDMESSIYSWINRDGSNMNCTFTGGKMQMKAQFNLK
ncbi:DUF3862 domain-containing protein [Clostridium peptidivorans]|uniref:DUF3862 domain-containing protein n=1 Tax=Clostridium peptidivorans TaxID=100174 RepID=UPI000BE2B3A4|nr:DUF3862 domain-containing protein [Clostridium peptidivorans]